MPRFSRILILRIQPKSAGVFSCQAHLCALRRTYTRVYFSHPMHYVLISHACMHSMREYATTSFAAQSRDSTFTDSSLPACDTRQRLHFPGPNLARNISYITKLLENFYRCRFSFSTFYKCTVFYIFSNALLLS